MYFPVKIDQPPTILIDVSCAIIEQDGKVLVTQRPADKHQGLKWEFPGGKVQPNETPEASIIREIEEELGVTIQVHAHLPPAIHDYGDKAIRLLPFVCCIVSGEVQLKEHQAMAWAAPEELEGFDWCEADIPIVRSYLLKQPNHG